MSLLVALAIAALVAGVLRKLAERPVAVRMPARVSNPRLIRRR